jgi:ribosomal protein S18 acetylase RimI-like enzyme
MSPVVCRADDAPISVDILVDAFYDDPTWSWVFPDPDRRRSQQGLLWRALVDGAMRYESVWLNDDATATAVWIPPGGTEMTPEREAELMADFAEVLSPDELARVPGVMTAFDEAHPHHEPHFTLSLLGTRTTHRGEGRGLRLLKDTLTVVDAAGMPAYLEASNPANIALYQRYGFERFGSFTLPGGATVTTMWRRPSSQLAV